MKGMVDVCGGHFTPRQIQNEITHYIFVYHPKRIVVEADRIALGDTYKTKIWISKEDFGKEET